METGNITFGPEVKEAFHDLKEKQRKKLEDVVYFYEKLKMITEVDDLGSQIKILKEKYDFFATRLDYAISLLEKQIEFLEKNKNIIKDIGGSDE